MFSAFNAIPFNIFTSDIPYLMIFPSGQSLASLSLHLLLLYSPALVLDSQVIFSLVIHFLLLFLSNDLSRAAHVQKTYLIKSNPRNALNKLIALCKSPWDILYTVWSLSIFYMTLRKFHAENNAGYFPLCFSFFLLRFYAFRENKDFRVRRDLQDHRVNCRYCRLSWRASNKALWPGGAENCSCWTKWTPTTTQVPIQRRRRRRRKRATTAEPVRNWATTDLNTWTSSARSTACDKTWSASESPSEPARTQWWRAKTCSTAIRSSKMVTPRDNSFYYIVYNR